MIGGMQGHQNGDAAWHREQLGHKTELEKANETIAAQAAVIERLKTVPMKYRRMQFNAELQNEVSQQAAAIEKLTKQRDEHLAVLRECREEVLARAWGLPYNFDALVAKIDKVLK